MSLLPILLGLQPPLLPDGRRTVHTMPFAPKRPISIGEHDVGDEEATSPDVRAPRSTVARTRARRDRVLQMLHDAGEVTSATMAAWMDSHVGYIDKDLRALERAGLVARRLRITGLRQANMWRALP